MSWQPITPDQALSGFSPQERGFLIPNLGGFDATSTAVAVIVGDEVAAAQGAVLAGGGRQGPIGTTPDQLRPDVLAIIRWRLLLVYPSLKALQTDARKDAFIRASEKLADVANGKMKVELPDPATAQNNRAPANGIQVIDLPGREATRRTLRAL